MRKTFNYKGISATIVAENQPALDHPIRGKSIYNPDTKHLDVLEDKPRPPRNKEVFRSQHLLVTAKRNGSDYRLVARYNTAERDINRRLRHEFKQAMAAVDYYQQQRDLDSQTPEEGGHA